MWKYHIQFEQSFINNWKPWDFKNTTGLAVAYINTLAQNHEWVFANKLQTSF